MRLAAKSGTPYSSSLFAAGDARHYQFTPSKFWQSVNNTVKDLYKKPGKARFKNLTGISAVYE
ncbi:hypothetical protein [Methylobacter sp. BlB1]|uniref:hypothetical protein n=1 Tax=Methylobacter sp. BlB1 TaxID=2785914 RepID=UPI00189468B9|nr:hypothetical protein [Methylobacter sp. BlB1]MBF6650570.1 hypothetical protein [Methylobacter sp. BlB1]